MQNNETTSVQITAIQPRQKTQSSFSLAPAHPLALYFRHFDDERMAMDSVLQMMGNVSIYLNEAMLTLNNQTQIGITMQGFRNLYESMTEYHNHREY